ncbi:mitochondrial import receptor subunit TOM70 [Halyomorpha halys]|uniref:mitochondrial import receptor subunit TOM70 n=1 Tax=Halyomorpha halys TaxID=286706 RepID=UPI0006D502F5|nr:mitochondrial import receptor subunit TOM70 [Halyomorpha halys]
MSNEPIVPKYSWSKWILAILIGIPAVAGTYYFMTKKQPKITDTDKNGICKPTKKKNVPKEDTSEIKQENHKVEETPLERSMKLKNSGNSFYKKGEYNEAIRCYTEAISMCPTNETEHLATLYQNRAASYDVLNETQKILDDCSAALKLKPDYLKALSRRYKAAEKLGKIRQALEDVTAVCLLENFNNMETLSAADRILKVIGKEEADKFMKSRSIVLPSDYFIKAYFASFAHDPVIADLPKSVTSDNELRGIEKAKQAMVEEKYSDIISACTEELENPSSDKGKEHALLLRSSMYILTWQIKEAMSDLTFLINTSSDVKVQANALLKRACLYMQAEEVDNAMADFDKAAIIDPNNPDIPHQRAQMYLLGEKLEEAVEEFQKAIALHPTSGLVLVQKLYAEYRLGVSRNDSSIAQTAKKGLQNAINKFPNTPEGYMLLAQVYNDAQDYEKAEATFDLGIKADEKNASILVHKGLLYLQWKGDIEKASKLIEKGIEVDPKCEFAYETLASIEVQKGNLMRAVTLFDKALPLAKSEREASHILSLRAAAQAQMVVLSQSIGREHHSF